MIDTAQAFGVDIGGSGIKAAPVDLNKGEFAEPRLKISYPRGPPRRRWPLVKQQLEHFEVPETAPVGISFPAPVKPGQKLNLIANLDQSWVGVDITEVLSEACGRPVTSSTTPTPPVLAEQQFGAAKGQEGLVVATTLGTGIGTALIMDGVLDPEHRARPHRVGAPSVWTPRSTPHPPRCASARSSATRSGPSV